MYVGPEVATDLDWIRGFACTRDVLDRLDPEAAALGLGRLRVVLAEHNSAYVLNARDRLGPNVLVLGTYGLVNHRRSSTAHDA